MQPTRTNDFHELLQSQNGLPQSSYATVVDWARWARQAKGSTVALAKGVNAHPSPINDCWSTSSLVGAPMIISSRVASSIERLDAQDNSPLSVWIRTDAEHTSRAAQIVDFRVVDTVSILQTC